MKRRNLAVCGVMLGALVSVNAVAQSEAQEDDQYYNDRYCMTCHGADGMAVRASTHRAWLAWKSGT